MMNIKLKKFNILVPKVKITTGLKTITRETSGGNTPISAMLVADSAGDTIIGNAQKEEEE
jgi:hypothetical protein